MRRSLFFVVTIGLIITTLVSFLFENFGKKDLVAYWSASYLLIHGQNPYDAEQLAILQVVDAQQQNDVILSAWNPPWLLVALFPFAVLPFDTAVFLWMLVSILLLGLCIYLCLILAGKPGGGRPFIWTFTTCLFLARH